MYKLVSFILLAACGAQDAPTVDLPVTTSATRIPAATSNLGYRVELTDVRIAVSTIELTTGGDDHAGAAAARGAPLAPPPHPGHAAGGDVTGELIGNFVLRWRGDEQPALGMGTLITGQYSGANFRLRAADETDELATDDRLAGHTFHLAGTVARGGMTRPFVAVLDVEADAAVIGAVFDALISEASTQTLVVMFLPTDPVESGTVFDDVDFFTLAETSGAIEIAPGSAAHNIIRRSIQTHNHYAVVAQ